MRCKNAAGMRVPRFDHRGGFRRYRLIVQRDGKRVRVWTRNGHDWSDRFPLISEAALRNRNSNFVIDGEAVLLGVDGRSDFNGLHSRKHDDEVQFYAFDMLVSDGDDLRKLPLRCARPTSLGCWHDASTGSFCRISNRARSGLEEKCNGFRVIKDQGSDGDAANDERGFRSRENLIAQN